MCICEWRGESCHFLMSKQNNSSVPFLHTDNMYIAYKSRKTNKILLEGAVSLRASPATLNYLHILRNDIWGGGCASLANWRIYNKQLWTSFHVLPLWVWYFLIIVLYPSLIHPIWRWLRAQVLPRRTNYPCLFRHELCTHFSWLPLEQLLSFGSGSAHRATKAVIAFL